MEHNSALEKPDDPFRSLGSATLWEHSACKPEDCIWRQLGEETAEAESRIRNAVLDEIEQRLDAQTEPDIYDGDDENTRVMIGRVTYKRIIEDMRHEV